jgi:hypothetical protein
MGGVFPSAHQALLILPGPGAYGKQSHVFIRVLDKNIPMIRDRIANLDEQDYLISNFSDELDKLEKEGY